MLEEKILWLNVLLQAMLDMAGVDPCATPARIPLLKRSARGWIESARTDPGSFLWICNSLDIDIEFARAALLNRAAELAQAKALEGSNGFAYQPRVFASRSRRPATEPAAAQLRDSKEIHPALTPPV